MIFLLKPIFLFLFYVFSGGATYLRGKLVADEFTKSKLRITITDLDKIFGTISFLLSSKNETE